MDLLPLDLVAGSEVAVESEEKVKDGNEGKDSDVNVRGSTEVGIEAEAEVEAEVESDGDAIEVEAEVDVRNFAEVESDGDADCIAGNADVCEELEMVGKGEEVDSIPTVTVLVTDVDKSSMGGRGIADVASGRGLLNEPLIPVILNIMRSTSVRPFQGKNKREVW